MFYSISTCFPSYCGPKNERDDFSGKEAAAIYADVFLTSLAVLGLAYACVALSGADLGPLNALSSNLGHNGLSTIAKGIAGFLTAEAIAIICSTCKRVSRLQEAKRALKATIPQTQTIEIRHNPDPELVSEIEQLKQQLTQLQGELARRPTRDALVAANQLTEQAKAAAAQKEEIIKKQIEELTQQLKNSQENVEKQNAQIGQLQRQVDAKETAAKKFIEQLGEITKEKATCDKTIEEQKQAILALQTELKAKEFELQKQLNSIQEAQKQIKQIHIEKEELEQRLGKIEALNQQISDKQKEMQQLQEKINHKDEGLTVRTNQLERLKKECELLTSQKQALADAEQTAQKTIETLNKQIEERQNEIKQLQERKSQEEGEIAARQQKLQQLQKECAELASKKQDLEAAALTALPPSPITISRLPLPDLESSTTTTTTTTTATTPDVSPIKFVPDSPPKENPKAKNGLLNRITGTLTNLLQKTGISLNESNIEDNWVMIEPEAAKVFIKEAPRVIEALGDRITKLDKTVHNTSEDLEIAEVAVEWADMQIALTNSIIEASKQMQPPAIEDLSIARITPPPPMPTELEQAVSDVKAQREELLCFIRDKNYALKHTEIQPSKHGDEFLSALQSGKDQLSRVKIVPQVKEDPKLQAIQNGIKNLKQVQTNAHKNGISQEQQNINQLAAKMVKATQNLAQKVADDFEQDWELDSDQPYEAPAEASIETKNIISLGQQLANGPITAFKPSEYMGMAKERSLSFRQENEKLVQKLGKIRNYVSDNDNE